MVKGTKEIWGTIKDLKLKQDLKNLYVSQNSKISKIKKEMHACDAAAGVKLG